MRCRSPSSAPACPAARSSPRAGRATASGPAPPSGGIGVGSVGGSPGGPGMFTGGGVKVAARPLGDVLRATGRRGVRSGRPAAAAGRPTPPRGGLAPGRAPDGRRDGAGRAAAGAERSASARRCPDGERLQSHRRDVVGFGRDRRGREPLPWPSVPRRRSCLGFPQHDRQHRVGHARLHRAGELLALLRRLGGEVVRRAGLQPAGEEVAVPSV